MAIDGNALVRAFREQQVVSDVQFDLLFPTGHRFRSYAHWTPIDVARRACALLAPRPDDRVLDVGSGVGKLCLIGALTSGATWVGVETDAAMIRVAEAAARRLEIADRAQFVHGDAALIDWRDYAAIYMFNPFAEGLLDKRDPTAPDRFALTIERTREQLATIRIGTRLVTYHGFGGQVPPGFELEHEEPARQDRLCLWVRRS